MNKTKRLQIYLIIIALTLFVSIAYNNYIFTGNAISDDLEEKKAQCRYIDEQRTLIELKSGYPPATRQQRELIEEYDRMFTNCLAELEELTALVELENQGLGEIAEKERECHELDNRHTQAQLDRSSEVDELSELVDTCFAELQALNAQYNSEDDIVQETEQSPIQQIQNLVQNILDFIRNIFS